MKRTMLAMVLALVPAIGCSAGGEAATDSAEPSPDTSEAVAVQEQGLTAKTWTLETIESCRDMCGASGSCSCLSPHSSTNPAGKPCSPAGALTWYTTPTSSQGKLFRCR